MQQEQNVSCNMDGVNWRKKQLVNDIPLHRHHSDGSNNNGIQNGATNNTTTSNGQMNGIISPTTKEKVKPRRLPIKEINWEAYMRSGNSAVFFWVAVTMIVLVLSGGEQSHHQELHGTGGKRKITTTTNPVAPPNLRSTPSNYNNNIQQASTIPEISSSKNIVITTTITTIESYDVVKSPTKIIMRKKTHNKDIDDHDDHYLSFVLKPLPEEKPEEYKRDFGNLRFSMRPDLKAPIPISIVGDYEKYEEQRTAYLDEINYPKHEAYPPASDREDTKETCRLTPWSYHQYPNCNQVHELVTERFNTNDNDSKNNSNDNDELQDFEVSYLSSGTYRDAFRFKRSHDVVDDNVVLKRLLLTKEQDSKGLGKIRNEAMVMERLSHSPRILDIYGFCGTSVQVEAMAGDFWKKIVPSPSGLIAQETLEGLPPPKRRQNNLTASEILQVSLDMAESLADLHGFEGGPITHADTHIEQWLIGLDGTIQLNDFNNAKQPKWDESNNKYCETNGGYGGVYRSPEEFVPSAQDESRDVFAYGNNIYTMLTGLWPFYDDEYKERSGSDIRKEIVAGRRPYVDPYYRNGTTYIESKLVQIMEECWKDRSNRPPIFDVVSFLREVKQNATKLNELQPSKLIKIPMNQ